MTARLDPIIERFRWAHHTIAMMFASGMTVQEISRRTGFTNRRLLILLDDPTFSELIEHYRQEGMERMKQALPDIMDIMSFNHVASLRQIGEQLEEADEEGAEKLPLPILLKIAADMGDRTGYSKHTSKSVTVDVSFANRLDQAIERSNQEKFVGFIEGKALPAEANLPAPSQRSVVQMPRPRTFRRA